jgi:hypothetical protein
MGHNGMDETDRLAELRLGNEIDKLASNVSLGRDAAGVHYRSGSIRGLEASNKRPGSFRRLH